jgi:hypothetical protein
VGQQRNIKLQFRVQRLPSVMDHVQGCMLARVVGVWWEGLEELGGRQWEMGDGNESNASGWSSAGDSE